MQPNMLMNLMNMISCISKETTAKQSLIGSPMDNYQGATRKGRTAVVDLLEQYSATARSGWEVSMAQLAVLSGLQPAELMQAGYRYASKVGDMFDANKRAFYSKLEEHAAEAVKNGTSFADANPVVHGGCKVDGASWPFLVHDITSSCNTAGYGARGFRGQVQCLGDTIPVCGAHEMLAYDATVAGECCDRSGCSSQRSGYQTTMDSHSRATTIDQKRLATTACKALKKLWEGAGSF